MPEPFTIEITATGPIGCGKTMAINAIVQAIARHSEFQWIDGRYYEVSEWKDINSVRLITERQTIELRLK